MVHVPVPLMYRYSIPPLHVSAAAGSSCFRISGIKMHLGYRRKSSMYICKLVYLHLQVLLHQLLPVSILNVLTCPIPFDKQHVLQIDLSSTTPPAVNTSVKFISSCMPACAVLICLKSRCPPVIPGYRHTWDLLYLSYFVTRTNFNSTSAFSCVTNIL